MNKKLEAKKILREKYAKEFNELSKNKELFNALKIEMNQREEKALDIKQEYSNMRINDHSQDIHMKKKHLASLEKFSEIRINSMLRMKIEKKRIIFELIEEEAKAEKSA